MAVTVTAATSQIGSLTAFGSRVAGHGCRVPGKEKGIGEGKGMNGPRLAIGGGITIHDMLSIDGSFGEGGGQILRTALGLSLVTGQPFRIENIRGNRARPGLRRQHLTAVRAAAQVGAAEVEDAALDSKSLSFSPSGLQSGSYRFEIGSAGSTILVLHTLLPALITADGPSSVEVVGGTHNMGAPPFEHFDLVYLDLLRRLGARVSASLGRAGFVPRGGGSVKIDIQPASHISPIEIVERGLLRRTCVDAMVAGLPRHIAQREIATVTRGLRVASGDYRVVELPSGWGPGNALSIVMEHEHTTEVVSGFGRKGTAAEIVAGEAVDEAQRYLDSNAAVGLHTADQFAVLLALAGGGSFTASAITLHLSTVAHIIELFLPVEVQIDDSTHPPRVTITPLQDSLK